MLKIISTYRNFHKKKKLIKSKKAIIVKYLIKSDIIQWNFYKPNHHYAEKHINLQKLHVKRVKPDRISLHDAVAVLQLKENSSKRSSNYRSLTVLKLKHGWHIY